MSPSNDCHFHTGNFPNVEKASWMRHIPIIMYFYNAHDILALNELEIKYFFLFYVSVIRANMRLIS